MNRHAWRWLLFRVVDWLTLRVGWGWLWRLWAWCILPEWLASTEELAHMVKHREGEDTPW